VYYIRHNSEPENRAELRLAVDAGSVLERDEQLGVAHFVEHMLFNGTERFEEQEIVNFMERIGMRFGPDVNAYTGFDETVYMLQIPTDSDEIIRTSFQVLSDWAGRATMTAEEIDRERGVVVEEWRARMQNVQGRISEQQVPLILHGSRYAERIPIGNPEIIQTADYETIRDFYQTWYRPDLMAIVAVGDFDMDQIESLIEAEFAVLDNPEGAPERPTFDVPGHEETIYGIVTDPEYPVTSVEIAFKSDARPIDTIGDYRTRIIERMFNNLFNRRLSEIAREPTSPFSAARVYRGELVRPSEFYGLQARTPEDSVLAAADRLITEALRIARHGFTETELERQKQELLREYRQAFDERNNTPSISFASEYVSHFLEDQPAPGIEFEYGLAQQLIPDITVADLDRLAEGLLGEEDRVVLVTMPERAGVDQPTEEELAAIMRRVQQREIAPYEDDVPDQPLIEEVPQPAEVVQEDFIEDLNVHTFTLANGVQVVIKPTDFRQDEVRMSAFSPGGHSLVSDEDYFDATNAAAIVARSGVGPFTRTQLQNRLSGKVVSVTPYIGELEEGLQGNASPEDLETLFQLVHLYFTEPRADSAAFRSFQNQQRPFLRNRRANPNAVFQDSLTAALYGDDIRFRPPTVDMIDDLDLRNAFEIYQDRFADASDFTFVFVGNVSPSEVRRLAQSYLGSLPATPREETWRDVRPELPPDVVRTEVYKGIADQSQTVLLFHGPIDYTLEERHRLQSLEDVLAIRLREDLREERAAVYGVGVNASSFERPEPRYQFAINFTSDPDRVDELIDAVFDQIERIKTEGPTEDELLTVQEQQRRERETQLRSNVFWMGSLSYYFDRDEDPRRILEYDRLIDSLTAEDVRQVAERYLNADRFVRAVLYPEERADSDS
ncbi:MAG: M16 family metallopeptidase, partial [Bacteroidota bacterium]